VRNLHGRRVILQFIGSIGRFYGHFLQLLQFPCDNSHFRATGI
jgi:hypothetical protein